MGKIERFPIQSEFSFFGSVNEKSSYRMGLMGTQTIPTPVERLEITFPNPIYNIQVSDAVYIADEEGEYFSFCGGWWTNATTSFGYLVLENELVRHNIPDRVLHIAKVNVDKTVFEETDVFKGYVFVKNDGRVGFAYRDTDNAWVVDLNVAPPSPMKIVAVNVITPPTATIYLDEVRLVCLIQDKSRPYVVSGLSNFYTFEHDRTINQQFDVVFNNRSDNNFFANPSLYWIYPYIIKAGAVFALDKIDGASVEDHAYLQKKFRLTIPNNNDLLALGVDFVFRRNPSLVFNNNPKFRGVLSFNDRLAYWTENRIYITDTGTLMTWGTAFEATEGVGGYVNLNDIITCKEVGGQLFAFTPYGVYIVGEVATGVWGVKRTELPTPVKTHNRWFITPNIYFSEMGFIDLKTRQPFGTNTKQLETILWSVDGTEGILLCMADYSKLPTHLQQQPLFLATADSITAFPLWDLRPTFVRIQSGFMIYGDKPSQPNKFYIHEWLPSRFVSTNGSVLPKETRWIYERSFQQEVYLKRWGLSLRLIEDTPLPNTGRLRALLRVDVFSHNAPTRTYWVLRPLKAGENRFIFPNRIRGSHFRFTLRVGFETNFGSDFAPSDEPTSGGLMDFFDNTQQNAVFLNDNTTYGDYEIPEVWYEYVALERSEGGVQR